jgi:2-phosphoglycerate kinase
MSLGLPVEEAYQLAFDVERALTKRKQPTFPKDELKNLVSDMIARGYGKQMAVRYLKSPKAPRQIMVTGKRFAYPFSKGILAKSISVIGLQPNDAVTIAFEVEKKLMEKGDAEIPREKLRAVAYELIMDRYGVEYARRYLLWRYIETSPKPLIILLGGATGSGKTSVGAELASRFGINRFISTDSIRQIMRTMFSAEVMPFIHASSFEFSESSKYLVPEDQDPAIVGFREQARRVAVGMNALVERAIEENTSLLVEGVHILPGCLKQEFLQKAHIISVTLIVHDIELHRARFYGRETQSSLRRAQRYIENFGRIRLIQDYIIRQAKKHNLPVIDNVLYDQTVLDVIQILTEYIYWIQEEELSESTEEKKVIEQHFKPGDD